MKIFVTGGNGFLGRALRNRLEGKASLIEAPSSEECNLLEDNSLRRFCDVEYDIIFHLAAWTQAGDFCVTNLGEQWVQNQRINTNVLDWWKSNQLGAKLVFIGSSCVYKPGSSLIEKEFMVGEPIESLYTYAMTKRMLYQGAYALGRQFGLKWLCLVPSTLYGVNYHNDGRQMHFIFDLIRKIIRGKEFGEQVVLWGDGTQRRELIHVEDFVVRLLHLNETLENQIINIGAGEDKTIREFAELICSVIDFDPNLITYDQNKYVGSKSKKLSIDKLLKCYPKHHEKMIPLEEGIKKTVEWFYKVRAYEQTK